MKRRRDPTGCDGLRCDKQFRTTFRAENRPSPRYEEKLHRLEIPARTVRDLILTGGKNSPTPPSGVIQGRKKR